MAEGKGGWLGHALQFPSAMAQNFWIAIVAWTTCFVVTIADQPGDQPRPESELEGLVYGLTEVPHDDGAKWYQRPVPLAIAGGRIGYYSEYLVCIICSI